MLGSSNTCYSKLLIADVDDINSILHTERKELELELKESSESVSICEYFNCILFHVT